MYAHKNHERRKFLMDFHPYNMAKKLPLLPSVRPMRKRREGKQNFTQVLPWAIGYKYMNRPEE